MTNKMSNITSAITSNMNVKIIKPFVVISLIILLLDSVYLSTFGVNYFMPLIRRIQNTKSDIKILPVVICYLLMVYGLYYFIIKHKKRPFDAFLLGILIYGVFESVNLALFRDWTYKAFIIDTLWGGILFYLTTTIYYLLY